MTEASCPVCGTMASKRIVALGDVTVLACPVCKVGITHPSTHITDADYANLSKWSSTVRDEEDKFRSYQREFLKYVRPFAKGSRLLDVGCSVGLLVDEAARMGFDASGIDLDPHGIEIGRAASRNVHQAALSEWKEKGYDVISLSHTLEHISRPVEFLRVCAERLSAGGIIAIVVPCYTGLLPSARARWWYGWVPSQHYFHYSPKGLQAVIELAGLRVQLMKQYSMDHTFRLSIRGGVKGTIKASVCYALAVLGAAIGRGDQVVCVASSELRTV